MEKPTWAEHLQPVGVYYEGIVDDASAVVERLTAETVTTFGTRRSRQLQLMSSEAGKENIPVKNPDDEVSYTIQYTDVEQQSRNSYWKITEKLLHSPHSEVFTSLQFLNILSSGNGDPYLNITWKAHISLLMWRHLTMNIQLSLSLHYTNHFTSFVVQMIHLPLTLLTS